MCALLVDDYCFILMKIGFSLYTLFVLIFVFIVMIRTYHNIVTNF